ncbi:nuclear pore complex protein NUP96 [Phalaenopsis equestris]|uniref:nuclear pore complex protein NUP96 n=1 Tax=Phalaenopsis equestris TaxID=78828 RepID=UPI0009E60CEE|nr:nuclear pore complex protein NUP96 [Phalaenopsis equestris]
MLPQCKKRRMYNRDAQPFLPIILSSEYFLEPSVAELASREYIDPGYCSRVPNFVIGRVGFGSIKFLDNTDVRWLNLEKIVKLDRHSVTVYENESEKPPIGEGLNKAAEVTLILKLNLADSDGLEYTKITAKLRKCADIQGAKFISFNQSSGEWKFLVHHFSRFGLGQDEDDDDVIMDDVLVQPIAEDHEGPSCEIVLSHSLPAHLGLDPRRMHELRMLMFAEEEDKRIDGSFPSDKRNFGQEILKEGRNRISSSPLKKSPVPLLEYNKSNSDLSPSRGILMTGQNKGLPLRVKRAEGFRLDGKHATPLSGGFSSNVVDAALFMGKSFRVGWGPNGILVHTGTPVGKTGSGLSSIIHVEKIAIDKTVRDEQNKVSEELVDFCFSFPLKLHKSLDHKTMEIKVGSSLLKLQKIISNRSMLPDICREYISIIEKQIEVPGLPASTRVLLMHQVTVWELIKVLFSERETNENFRSSVDDVVEEMVLDKKDGSLNIDPEANPLLRRAEFSYWLRDSVCHRVQEDVSCLNDSNYLENILVFLTGRQVDAAVELAASEGDVGLAILLSQTGGSMVNRADMAQQLDIWKDNGMDFSYIEKERLKLYELLAGNIQGSLQDWSVDWKRHLGMVMWYQLPPDTQLPVIINAYEQLLSKGRAPHPVPVYIDEGPLIDGVEWNVGDRYDISYYLMLLYANAEKAFGLLKVMFSAFSSTFDPLDCHMIWHQRAVLESIGAFSSKDLQVVDISFVSQLLCLGLCHWAIYVVIQMPCCEKFPYLQANLIKEILLQYCETWSMSEEQHKFIVELGVPSTWMHEALATYNEYYRNLPAALEHYLKCSKWEKAHSIFMTEVAHSLYLSSKDSEIWSTASIMEEHKLEIADWDIGGGIFIDFYILRSSLQEDTTQSEPDLLARKNKECRDFFSRLNQSLRVWGSRLPVDARATYSRMAEELSDLLQSIPGEGSTPSVQMSCFETMLDSPIPQDLRGAHLQEALSVFTYLLAHAAS